MVAFPIIKNGRQELQCNIEVPFIQTRQNGQPFTIRGLRSCESSSSQYFNVVWLWLQFFFKILKITLQDFSVLIVTNIKCILKIFYFKYTPFITDLGI